MADILEADESYANVASHKWTVETIIDINI